MYNHGREISPDDNEENPTPSCSYYVNEVRESISSNEGSSPNLTMGYHRSSSSSTASSGKQLVKSHQLPSHGRTHHTESFYGRLERGYSSRDARHFHHHHHRRGDGLSSSSPSPSPEAVKKKPPMFFLGPPSSPGSIRSHSPLRSSPSSSPSPEMPSTPVNERVTSPHLLHPNFALNLNPSLLLTPPDKDSKVSSVYDAYWQIPRASLWCKHRNCEDPDETCKQCQMKDEVSSTCSSVSPPPTFTAMDNYQPIRRRPKTCVCGAVLIATTILSTIILIFITAFILYFEIVLKNQQYVPRPM